MSPLDIFILIIIATGIIRGLFKGFIFELALIGIMIVCYFLGFKAANFVSAYLSSSFKMNGTTLHYTSYVITFIGISVAIFFIAKLLEGLVNVAGLGVFNKIGGAVFGGLKFAFVLSLIFFFFNKINFDSKYINSDAKAESKFYYPVLKIAPAVLPLNR